ncbi:MAG: hypothetical protein R3D86_08660 [Emcibacteraceae bacterium]
MIEIVGANEGQEYEAALHLRKLILAVWPDLSQHKLDHIKMFVSLKLYGQKNEDIDIFLVGHFEQPREFDVEMKFYPRNGEPFVPRRASIQNFALAIEVKSHNASGVRFDDKLVSVKYPRGWECVTEKAFKQVFELKIYLKRAGLPSPYVKDMIFMSGLRENDLPTRPHNCFGIDASFEKILNIIGQISQPQAIGRFVNISFGPNENFNAILSPEATVMKTLEPTALDRGRMDRIIKSALPDNWLSDLSKKQVILRGRGGVGKTVLMLQMAYREFDINGMRSLFLTYNKALVADMRRTMALLGVPRNIEKGGIGIETVHSFVGRLMYGLGIIGIEDDFLDNYEKHKKTLLDYLISGTVTIEDLSLVIERQANEFAWDVVFIDEGQDWPSNEIKILHKFFGPKKIVVADGVDQYVRDSVANWDLGLARELIQPRRLKRCLRMKANLAIFVSDCAELMGLSNWDLEPNTEANGGRIIIIEGEMENNTKIVDQFILEAASLGNYPVDMLACVPPSLIVHEENSAYSLPGQAIQRTGKLVWDATSADIREHYPTERDALRIVQYESCRGLEGWIVINYALDNFYEIKFNQFISSPQVSQGQFKSKEELALIFAAQWLMIPLTRAMDTLVINLTSQQTFLKSIMIEIYKKRTDFVEWIKLDS